MIKTYKKRPVEIQAVQWTGSNREEIEEFTGGKAIFMDWLYVKTPDLIIPTLEGNYQALVDDYIIRGVKGEFYPCKPDIFEETYIEKVKYTESDFQGQVCLFDYDDVYPGLITED